jgi:hypothetical protein
VTVGRRGPNGGDSREDNVFLGRGGDSWAAWTRRRWWRGREGSGVVPTVEEERDDAVPKRSGEGRANDAVLRCGDGVEAVGVVVTWTRRR